MNANEHELKIKEEASVSFFIRVDLRPFAVTNSSNS